jgi:hypothetical protein
MMLGFTLVGWKDFLAPQDSHYWAPGGGGGDGGGGGGGAGPPAAPLHSPLPMNLGQSCWLLIRSPLECMQYIHRYNKKEILIIRKYCTAHVPFNSNFKLISACP